MFYVRKEQQITVAVRVLPNARRAGIEGLWNGTHLKVALTAPPVDGKANEALIDVLADWFSVRKSAISIISGQTGRQKQVAVTFPSDVEVMQAIGKLNAVG